MDDRPLIAAVQAGDGARVSALLAAGHDVGERGEQDWPALNFAAGRGDLAMVRLLIEAGADVFATGRDRRTAYAIAIAASHLDVARALKAREEAVGGDRDRISSREWETRPYCKAYRLADLSAFPSWREPDDQPASTTEASPRAADAELVFIHQDYAVTRSIWRDRDVLLDGTAADWRRFCDTTLGFRVPAETDDDPSPTPSSIVNDRQAFDGDPSHTR